MTAAEPVHRALGLTDEELAEIERLLGRPPNHLELAMYAVMWSEHCSYKSSRVHLTRLPTAGERVVVGPGENAGVVEVADGVAAAIRIESHNHPSAIEPYEGAATGVGGIIRDIFTMGARPVALMDSLRFGTLDDARTRWIFEGVVDGISGYGNSVGVPTVGGETVFDPTYAENPLVNVLCLGLVATDEVVLARASGVGNLAVLLGATTGRDGIGGASVLASAGFGADDAAKRPSVQVGDPFEEKRLIEACLELYRAGLVVAVQDLGAAGLAGATSETAARGGVGMDVDVAAVPRREPGMEPFEVMTSESQERMLAVVEPGHLDEVLAICRRWEVRATVVGGITGSGRLRVLDGPDGPLLADMPAASLAEDAPRYERPVRAPAPRRGGGHAEDSEAATSAPVPGRAGADLLELLVDRSWVWRQYDHQLFLNTVVGPGADATVLRLKHPATGADTGRGIALTCDGNAAWCAVDPRRGTAMVVAEAVLNLACVGAAPVALVNCLNFGSPEHPEVMWQLSESIDGMAEACRALGIPVVGGNVSLYNEAKGRNIDPTPVVGLLGVLERLEVRPPGPTLVPGGRLLLLGPPAGARLDGSEWARRRGERGTRLPEIDLRVHTRVADLVRRAVADGLAAGVHDVSAGGLAVALGELVTASGTGLRAAGVGGAAAFFSESPSRVVVCAAAGAAAEIAARAEHAGVDLAQLGEAGGGRLVVDDLVDLPVEDVVARARAALPGAVAAGAAH